MKILVLNAGSSTQKSCLFDLADTLPDSPPAPLWEAFIQWNGDGGEAHLKVKNAHGVSGSETLHGDSRPAAIRHMLGTLWDGRAKAISAPASIDVVGHRVVHGGHEYHQATLITPEVKAAISRFAAFAPLHNPPALEGIQTIGEALGNVPQIAMFDTAFFSGLPMPAVVYPGPYDWYESGIRRYGFHGINHQYCAERAAGLLGKDLDSLRLITCHLGNGCSLAAIREGHAVDTTMGFTPLEGLMMGTRSGSVDPGILIHLLRENGYSAERLDQVLNHESGLLGISGVSSDMRQVLAAMAAGNPRARLAFDLFVHRLRSCLGALLASLGGLDALVFTAGIGENSPAVRAAACEAFAFLGLKIDADNNAHPADDRDIATVDSAVRVLVVRAQEDWAIARACWRFVQALRR